MPLQIQQCGGDVFTSFETLIEALRPNDFIQQLGGNYCSGLMMSGIVAEHFRLNRKIFMIGRREFHEVPRH